MSGGCESAEETMARANAQADMKATVSAAGLRTIDALIRRNCRFGVRDPGPKQ
jgi:hypothetical protein